jgi:SAM-dependent methyltransferase
MPDFCVQVGTSLPRNGKHAQPRPPANKAEAKRRAAAVERQQQQQQQRQQQQQQQPGASAASSTEATPAAATLTAAAYHSSAASQSEITGSREQRKKARAARFPRIIVADTVTDYRRIIPLLIGPADIVLEVGCCSGATTNVLADHCSCAVGARAHRRNLHTDHCWPTCSRQLSDTGVDLSETELAKARARYPDVEFHLMGTLRHRHYEAPSPRHAASQVTIEKSIPDVNVLRADVMLVMDVSVLPDAVCAAVCAN